MLIFLLRMIRESYPHFAYSAWTKAMNYGTTEVCLDCLSLFESQALAFSVTRLGGSLP